MKEERLWNKISTPFVLTLSTAGCLCDQSNWRVSDFFHYDYIGGYTKPTPQWKDIVETYQLTVGPHPCLNGGISLRKVESCKQVLKIFFPGPTQSATDCPSMEHLEEGLYFATGLLLLDKRVASDFSSLTFCSCAQMIPGSFALYMTDSYIGDINLWFIFDYCPEFVRHVHGSQQLIVDEKNPFQCVFRSWYQEQKEGDLDSNGDLSYVQFVLWFLTDHKVKSILDIGCGNCIDWLSHSINFTSLFCSYRGIDCAIRPSPYDCPRFGISFTFGDIFTELKSSLLSSNFDLILIKDVFSYWPTSLIVDLLLELIPKCKFIVVTDELYTFIEGGEAKKEAPLGVYRTVNYDSLLFKRFSISILSEFVSGKIRKRIHLIQGQSPSSLLSSRVNSDQRERTKEREKE
jgi:hypothetical protein